MEICDMTGKQLVSEAHVLQWQGCAVNTCLYSLEEHEFFQQFLEINEAAFAEIFVKKKYIKTLEIPFWGLLFAAN